MDGMEKLHEAGFWPSLEKVFDSTLSDTGMKSYQHVQKDIREPLSPGDTGDTEVPKLDGDTEVPKLEAQSL